MKIKQGGKLSMDIKRQYFDLIEERIKAVYECEHEKYKEVAKLFGECMENLGVVQLFGVNHGEEFVNELNYRAGGIAPYHGLKFKDLMLAGKVDQKDIDSGEILNDASAVDKFFEFYQMDDRDMICLVSYYGNEPVVLALAKRYKENGQKVVAVINKKSYDKTGSNLLDYCDMWLDMGADDPDVAMHIGDTAIGQLSSTTANVIAQMLTAEVYNYYVSSGKEAPVLLSANIKGADVHNNSLTDPYERRVR